MGILGLNGSRTVVCMVQEHQVCWSWVGTCLYECSSPLDKRLLRAAWFGPEGSDSNENGSGKGSFQEWFRSLMKGGRGGGRVGGSLR